MLTAPSLSEYLKIVSDLRKEWKVKDHKELWFRAESSTHVTTRLQPGLYRPRAGSTRKTIKELLALENDLYEEFERCAPQLSDRLIG